MKKYTDNNYFHYFIFGSLMIYGLYPYFTNGHFPLGGDGDYHIIYSRAMRYIHAWHNDGLGSPNYGPHSVTITFLISAVEWIFRNVSVVKFIIYLSVYFMTYFTVYSVCKKMEISNTYSYLLSLFYVINPFSFTYLARLNISLSASLAAMMIYFYIVYNFYKSSFDLFFFFGTSSLLIAFSSLNPPIFVIIQISIIISVGIAVTLHNEKFILREWFKKYCIVIASFILFNFWWIVNWISFVVSGTATEMYTPKNALSLLNNVIRSAGTIMMKLITFRYGFSANTWENYFGKFYHSQLFMLLSLIPCIIIIIKVNKLKNENNYYKICIYMMLFYLITVFLSKGYYPPFGFLFLKFFDYVPLFYVFKGPLEKFGVLAIYIFTITLMLLFKKCENNRQEKYLMILFGIYILFCFIPIFTQNVFPDTYIGYTDGMQTVKYKDRTEYGLFRKDTVKDEMHYRIIQFPGSKGYYEITFKMEKNNYYSGVDPLINNTNKAGVIYTNKTKHLFENLSENSFDTLLGVYNIRKVVVNDKIVPRYGFPEKENLEIIKGILSKKMGKGKQYGDLLVFDNKTKFYPYIYPINNITIVSEQ
jgi:hypothetical protein